MCNSQKSKMNITSKRQTDTRVKIVSRIHPYILDFSQHQSDCELYVYCWSYSEAFEILSLFPTVYFCQFKVTTAYWDKVYDFILGLDGHPDYSKMITVLRDRKITYYIA